MCVIWSRGRTDHETGLAERTEVGEGEEEGEGEACCLTECQGYSPSISLACQGCRETSGPLHFQVLGALCPRGLYTFHQDSLTEFFLAAFLLLS